MAGDESWVPHEEDDWTGEHAQLIPMMGKHLARIIDTRFWVGAPAKADADGAEWVHALCPPMDRVVAISEFLPKVRRVTGVVHTPLILADGSLLQDRGYSRALQVVDAPHR